MQFYSLYFLRFPTIHEAIYINSSDKTFDFAIEIKDEALRPLYQKTVQNL